MKKRGVTYFIDKLISIIAWVAVIIVFVVVIRVFFFSSFKIPSNSMYPTLIDGDNVIINKAVVGAKLYNLFAAWRGEEVKIYKLPNMCKIKRNDILVFYFPYPYKNNIISLDPDNYYIKRCVAISGDTLEIINGYYCVRGTNEKLGNKTMQNEFSAVNDSLFNDSTNIYPNNIEVNWSKKNFGPLYIPRKGDTIEMNRQNIMLYKNLIEWEQDGIIDIINSQMFIDNRLVETYIFKKNYYFMAGDNVFDSYDSRNWGLLPEDLVVGKAWFIWKSVNKEDNRIHWGRVFKKVQ